MFLASTGPGDAGYELQVLDSYNNKTYVNGQAGSIYKQAHSAGERRTASPANGRPTTWCGRRPRFNDDGSVKTPAYVTVFFNGVLVQNHFELKGETLLHRQAVLQEVRQRADQAAGARRPQRADQLPEYLGPRAAVARRQTAVAEASRLPQSLQ